MIWIKGNFQQYTPATGNPTIGRTALSGSPTSKKHSPIIGRVILLFHHGKQHQFIQLFVQWLKK